MAIALDYNTGMKNIRMSTTSDLVVEQMRQNHGRGQYVPLKTLGWGP